MTRRELILQLMEGPMNDEVSVVDINAAEDDDFASHEITQIAETDDGNCYLYVDLEG